MKQNQKITKMILKRKILDLIPEMKIIIKIMKELYNSIEGCVMQISALMSTLRNRRAHRQVLTQHLHNYPEYSH